MAYFITEKCNGCTACARKCPVGAISGERKTRHVVNKELCAECGVCGRICPTEAVVDGNERIVFRVPLAQWPKPHFDFNSCMSCNICIQSCPFSCLEISEPQGKDPHGHPVLANPAACIGCGLCRQDCPVDAIIMKAAG